MKLSSERDEQMIDKEAIAWCKCWHRANDSRKFSARRKLIITQQIGAQIVAILLPMVILQHCGGVDRWNLSHAARPSCRSACLPPTLLPRHTRRIRPSPSGLARPESSLLWSSQSVLAGPAGWAGVASRGATDHEAVVSAVDSPADSG